MKARVKATGEIIEVMYSHTSQDKGYDIIWYITPQGVCFSKEELEFIDTGESLDYWTHLKHQYAGMAMQGLLTNPKLCEIETSISIANTASTIASALIDKLKEESHE